MDSVQKRNGVYELSLDSMTLALAAFVIFAAYLIRGIAGFGSALIAVPLLGQFVPLIQVVPLIVLLDYLGSAGQGIKNRKMIAWAELLPLIPFAIAGTALAIGALRTSDDDVLRPLLGIFVMVYAVYLLLPLPPLRGSRLWSSPLGFLGGFVGTLFGTGGPFVVIYLTLRSLEKSSIRATFAANFLIDGGIRLVAFTSFGFFAPDNVPLMLAAVPVAAFGLYLGGRIHLRMQQSDFVRLISALLLISGLALVLRA